MLTRLKVSGFKNLVDVDVRFGPFTCIAGANGVGKSNLFDAIRFLSALADHTLVEAALTVRDEAGRTTDVTNLFHQVGDHRDKQMFFEAEMIVPDEGVDDLGQRAKASITFLRYSLILTRGNDESVRSQGSLQLSKEELTHINLSDAPRALLFPHSAKDWRATAVHGRRFSPLISTEGEGINSVIKLHQDGSSGRPLARLAPNLPRTVLSAANAAESPTALLARREMQSWHLIQLEPSALRKPDEFSAPSKLGSDGSHLPATLYHLAQSRHGLSGDASGNVKTEARVYGQVANRVSQLIDDVQEVRVDRDERRELLTLEVTDGKGTAYPARALSDGTLRFLALAVLELEPEAEGVICLEEPENGIHPKRIPAMLQLLQDIATDVFEPIGSDNPLRQVVINTHSPAVVSQVPDESLIVAELRETIQGNRRFNRVCFSSLPDTWRAKAIDAGPPVSRGKLLDYLYPVSRYQFGADTNGVTGTTRRDHQSSRRVIDRPDLQLKFSDLDSPA